MFSHIEEPTTFVPDDKPLLKFHVNNTESTPRWEWVPKVCSRLSERFVDEESLHVESWKTLVTVELKFGKRHVRCAKTLEAESDAFRDDSHSSKTISGNVSSRQECMAKLKSSLRKLPHTIASEARHNDAAKKSNRIQNKQRHSRHGKTLPPRTKSSAEVGGEKSSAVVKIPHEPSSTNNHRLTDPRLKGGRLKDIKREMHLPLPTFWHHLTLSHDSVVQNHSPCETTADIQRPIDVIIGVGMESEVAAGGGDRIHMMQSLQKSLESLKMLDDRKFHEAFDRIQLYVQHITSKAAVL